MRLVSKKILVVPVFVAGLALAGCGGDDDPATMTGGGETPSTKDAGALTPGQREKLEERRRKAERLEREAGGRGGFDGGSTAEVRFKEPTVAAPTNSGSLPNEGTRRVAPGVPTAKGGDNSIQEHGIEAPAADRVEASRVFQAYLNARLGGEWALACSYMTASIKRQVTQLGGSGGGCAQAMRGFTQNVPGEALRIAADIRVLSMRVEGGQAFLLYKDGDGLPSAVPMNEEGGAWKVGAIAGSALFLGV